MSKPLNSSNNNFKNTYEQIFTDYTISDSEEFLEDIIILSQSPFDESNIFDPFETLLTCDDSMSEHFIDSNFENENDHSFNIVKTVMQPKTSTPNFYLCNSLKFKGKVNVNEDEKKLKMHYLENLNLDNSVTDQKHSFTRNNCVKRKSSSDWIINKKSLIGNVNIQKNLNFIDNDNFYNEINSFKSDFSSKYKSDCSESYKIISIPSNSNSSLVETVSTNSYKQSSFEDNVYNTGFVKILCDSSEANSHNPSVSLKKERISNVEIIADSLKQPVVILKEKKRRYTFENGLSLSRKIDSRKRFSLPSHRLHESKTLSFLKNKASQFILPSYDISYIENFEVGFLDTHCHLDFLFKRENFQGTYVKYQLTNSETFPKSYQGCITVFCDPQSFAKKSEWENLLKENNVWAAFGCHPHSANEYNEDIEKYMIDALIHPRVVALGEIGLDYSSRNSCDINIQQDVFRKQLKIAVEKNLPLVIHCRDAHEDCIRILKEEIPYDYYIHRHCFTGEWDEAEIWLKTFTNLYLGITNLVTYPSARSVHEVARKVPLNRLLLETDAPYFVPKHYTVKDVKVSHPGMALHVAAQIAALRSDVTIQEVLHAVRSNTYCLYGV